MQTSGSASTPALSGRAASVVGACALSGLRNAIIADMGGTTTDIAVVNGGQPELGSDGVRIGEWKPMVEAVRVISIGLGGDSEVRFSGRGSIEIGPRRVVPLSLLAHRHPEVEERLQAQLDNGPNRRNLRFALPLERNEVMLAVCTGAEYAQPGGALPRDQWKSTASLGRAGNSFGRLPGCSAGAWSSTAASRRATPRTCWGAAGTGRRQPRAWARCCGRARCAGSTGWGAGPRAMRRPPAGRCSTASAARSAGR
jgi:hypothetical protein